MDKQSNLWMKMKTVPRKKYLCFWNVDLIEKPGGCANGIVLGHDIY